MGTALDAFLFQFLHEFLSFVAQDDGSHFFSKEYSAHTNSLYDCYAGSNLRTERPDIFLKCL